MTREDLHDLLDGLAGTDSDYVSAKGGIAANDTQKAIGEMKRREEERAIKRINNILEEKNYPDFEKLLELFDEAYPEYSL